MAKDYAAIAAQRIHRVGASERQPRILVYGRNKKGKTRFSTTAPNVLILDPEDGTAEEKTTNPDVWPISEWSDFDDVYGWFKSGKAVSPVTKKPYEWISFDGMTRIGTIALNFVSNQQAERDLTRKPGQIDQRTYGQANKMIEGMLHNFHTLRHVGLIFTVQERMIEIENMEELDDDDATPKSYQYVPDLPKGARAPLNQIVDCIGRIYVVKGDDLTTPKRVRGEDGKIKIVRAKVRMQRRLYIGPDDMYDTGYRSAHTLPDFIKNPTVPTLVDALRNGKVPA